MNNIIKKIIAEEVLDSRNKPTIKVTVYSESEEGSFSVPSGASTGFHEAIELRDSDNKGVSLAINNINNIIAPALIGKNVLNQKEIDETMINLDGTLNKSKLGGNSVIGVSIACAELGAKVSGLELYQYLRTLKQIKPSQNVPHLYMNLINGGKHANNNLAFQEYHIVTNTEDINEAVKIGFTVQESLRKIIQVRYGDSSLVLGDEGGYAPLVSNIKEPLLLLKEAVTENNLQDKVRFALDVAASSFYENNLYKVDGKDITKEELMGIYDSLVKEFNLISIEDAFDEEDFESFKKLKENNPNLIVMGDDLTVTNKVLLQKAIELNSINAMIIKPNQIGTLSETLDTMQLARDNNIELIISHRSGETLDTFIADLSYAFSCFGLKSGSPVKEERIVKYNRLIEIIK